MQLIICKIDDFRDLDIVMDFLTCCYRNILMEENVIAKTKEKCSSWRSYDYAKTIDELIDDILKTIKPKDQEIDDLK